MNDQTQRDIPHRELLDDEFFISSIINPSLKSKAFWEDQIEKGLISSHEYEFAASFVQSMQRPTCIVKEREKNELILSIEIEIKKMLQRKLNQKRIYLYSAVASILVLFAISGYFFLTQQVKTEDYQALVSGTLNNSASNNIQLVLSNDKKVELEEKSVDFVLEEGGKISANSKELIAQATSETVDKKESSKANYLQLIVPFGKHSNLTLPDGTKIHVNSGTKIAFPDKFNKKERDLYVNGEAYLEVAHDDKVPFIVHTDQLDVRVLGTSFNVNAYESELTQSVVLVKGSVNVITKDKRESVLVPNQKMEYVEGKCLISTIDASDFISWKDGYYIYHSESLEQILKQISRYYGIIVECRSELSNIRCSGKLDMKEDLNKVLTDLTDFLQLKIQSDGNSKYLIL